jgi:hypothetical protein
VNSGFADRGLTTWLPRRILLPEPIRWLSTVSMLILVANCCQFSGTTQMSGRQLGVVPYNGNRAYKYYLDDFKVNDKRKRLSIKDEAAANRKLAELARQQRKEGPDGLDIPPRPQGIGGDGGPSAWHHSTGMSLARNELAASAPCPDVCRLVNSADTCSKNRGYVARQAWPQLRHSGVWYHCGSRDWRRRKRTRRRSHDWP